MKLGRKSTTEWLGANYRPVRFGAFESLKVFILISVYLYLFVVKTECLELNQVNRISLPGKN